MRTKIWLLMTERFLLEIVKAELPHCEVHELTVTMNYHLYVLMLIGYHWEKEMKVVEGCETN